MGLRSVFCLQLAAGAAAQDAPNATLYKCQAGTCAEATTGVDLPTCQALCTAPGPAPPPPSSLYRCSAGQCTVSDTGVDLATCQSLCKAPATPAPPGQLYRCTGNQCSASPDGVDLATCQALCRAPAPPAPAPPVPVGPPMCDGSCVECIEDFVLEIFESASACLGGQIVGCVENILTDIYNGIGMITGCGSAADVGADNRAALARSAAIAKLRKLALGSSSEPLRRAAARLPFE